LWMLQKTEQETEDIQIKLRTYPLQVEHLQKQLEELDRKKSEEQDRIENLEKERRKKEGELELESERIRKSQLRLLEVKTNKEYQAMLKEIEWAKEINSQREEEIITILDEIDRSKSNLGSIEQRIEGEKKETEQEIATIQQKMVQLEKDLANSQEVRNKIIQELDPQLLKRYVTLKERRDGVAIVLVKNEACQGCYVNIPPQLYNEVQQSKEIILCPNCNRILYADNEQTR